MEESKEVSNAETEQPALTIVDLQILGQAIDVASQRGAYRTAEFTQIGGVYNKLTAFIKYASELEKANAEANPVVPDAAQTSAE